MRPLNWLSKLERKFGKFAIPNLMTILIFGMTLVALVDIFSNPDYTVNLSSILAFDRELIFQGQVWRILTFVLIPPGYSLLTIAFTLYFYWLIGTALENQWGSFCFNVYYFCGVLGTLIGGFITGYATNYYINLSLFLAFAMLYPNNRVLLFFFIPIKMKYLAMIDIGFMVLELVFSAWPERVALLISLANFLLFFLPGLVESIRRTIRRKKYNNRRSKGGTEQNQNWKKHWWDDNQNNPFH